MFCQNRPFQKPQFLDESKALVGKMKKMTPPDLMSLMTISENLAELNWERMQNWDEDLTLKILEKRFFPLREIHILV